MVGLAFKDQKNPSLPAETRCGYSLIPLHSLVLTIFTVELWVFVITSGRRVYLEVTWDQCALYIAV